MTQTIEVHFEDVMHGQAVLRLDPPVIEYFTERHGSVARVHTEMADIRVGDQHRRGHRQVDVRPSRRHDGGFTANVPEAVWPQVLALFEAARGSAPG